MNIIYNSENFYVVEYPAQHGYELVDKQAARSTFFQGGVAERFLESMQIAVNQDASVEHVDEFFCGFRAELSLECRSHLADVHPIVLSQPHRRRCHRRHARSKSGR